LATFPLRRLPWFHSAVPPPLVCVQLCSASNTSDPDARAVTTFRAGVLRWPWRPQPPIPSHGSRRPSRRLRTRRAKRIPEHRHPYATPRPFPTGSRNLVVYGPAALAAPRVDAVEPNRVSRDGPVPPGRPRALRLGGRVFGVRRDRQRGPPTGLSYPTTRDCLPGGRTKRLLPDARIPPDVGDATDICFPSPTTRPRGSTRAGQRALLSVPPRVGLDASVVERVDAPRD